MSLDQKYRLEVLERCEQWCRQDEGILFWRWLKNELQRVTDGADRYIGAYEQERIIKANKMLARKEEAEWIAGFLDRLQFVISEKKKSGEDLTDIQEL